MRRLLIIAVTALVVLASTAQASTLAEARAALPRIFGKDASFMRCIVQRESSWNPKAISSTGDHGLAQLNAATWRRHFGKRWQHVYDPVANLRMAHEVLRIQGRRAWAGGAHPCP